MKTKWTAPSTLILFMAIVVVGFVFWLGCLFLIWPRVLSIPSDFWAMAEAISTSLAAIAVFGAGFIAHRELSEVASSRHMEVANKLFEELNSKENIEARRWIFLNFHDNPEEGIQLITPEGRAAIKQVLNSLDHVSFLTQAGWIPDDLVMPWMHPMIAKSWEKLEPYIIFERNRRNEPYYYKYAEQLAERCNSWRTRNLPQIEVKWVKDAL